MNKAVRILVANRPKVMREAILGTLSDQPWIEVVGEVANDADIPECVSKTLPDLLVIAVDGPGKRPALCDVLLQEHPQSAYHCRSSISELRCLLLGLAGYSLRRHRTF